MIRRTKISLIILSFFILCFLFPAWFYQKISFPVSSSEEVISFSVEKGDSLSNIAKSLKEKGLIKNSLVFKTYVFFKGVRSDLKAGEYQFSPNMNIIRIVNNLVLGSVEKSKIVIPEGWALKDIAEYLGGQGVYSEEEFLKATGSPFPFKTLYSEFDFLLDKPEDLDIEGYFFPDTYEISYDTSLYEFIKKALSNFDKKLTPELRSEIASQNKTIFEIITMASIIEKEVKTLKDKKIVSGILWKRMEDGMPLQVDAALVYAMGGKTKGVLIEDTKIDSLYNTYKHKGLPLGPISNPGLESIEAAIYPEDSPYWFYLSANNGKTIFSRTFEEHKRAKAIYLK